MRRFAIAAALAVIISTGAYAQQSANMPSTTVYDVPAVQNVELPNNASIPMPEPGGILALTSAMVGFVGVALRKRTR